MGLTPNYALPYPELTDTADVPRDVRALADKLDALPGLAPSSPIPLVAALPAGPVEGQEVYYQPAPPAGVNPVLWHLRFTAGKWLALGGEPWAALAFTTDQVVAVNAWGVVANGPSMVVPAAGIWRANAIVQQGMEAVPATSSLAIMRNAIVPTYAFASATFAGGAAFTSGNGMQGDFTCVAGDTLAVGQHRTAQARLGARWLMIRPVSLN